MKRLIFKRYVVMAVILILIISMALAVNNFILLGSLNGSLRARTDYLLNNGIRYIEDRIDLYSVSATNVSKNSHVLYFANMQERTNDTAFYNQAKALLGNLSALRDTSNEIADVLVFFDNLDIFFTPNGAWNHVFIPLWEISYAYTIDLSLKYSDTRATIFSSNGYVVFYNNFQRGVHVFLLIYQSALEDMLAQLIPVDYGSFVATNRSSGLVGDITITNGLLSIDNAPDIFIYGTGIFTYRFYYNALTYRNLVRTMTFIAIGIAMVIMLTTVLILYKIKKRLYDPLDTILQLIDNNHGGNLEDQDEFSIIQDTIDLMRTSLAEMNENQRCLNFNQVISAQVSEELYTLTELRSKYFCALTILFEDEQGNKNAIRTRAYAKDAEKFINYPVYTINKYSIYFFFLEDEAAYMGLIDWANSLLRESGFCQCGISSLYTSHANIKEALEESVRCFHEVYTEGLDMQHEVFVPGGKQDKSDCRISSENHMRLISDVVSRDIEKVKHNLLVILNENNQANALAKRQLLLCLYDTVCMLANNGAAVSDELLSKRTFFENIYNLRFLFDCICTDLEERIKTHSDEQEMLNWVEENLHRDISLSSLADAMGMSYSYTGIMFKNKVGTTFVEYLQKKRVERSIKLLVETNMPIEEIASVAGFVSVSTFFRVFKKCTGVTPGKYREIAVRG